MTPSAKQRTEAAEMVWIALAYHEAALKLAVKGARESLGRYRYLDLPVLNLFHQCAELLYKAALNQAGASPPRTHNLAELEEACAIQCPHMTFVVPKSLGDHKAGMDGLFNDFPRSQFQSLGLRYRYPSPGLPNTAPRETDWSALLEELNTFNLQTRNIWRDIILTTFQAKSTTRDGPCD